MEHYTDVFLIIDSTPGIADMVIASHLLQ